jgi:hypothetical protein
MLQSSPPQIEVVSAAGGYFNKQDREYMKPNDRDKMINDCIDMMDSLGKLDKHRSSGEVTNLVLANYKSFGGLEENPLSSE